jgi:hypothetical protein
MRLIAISVMLILASPAWATEKYWMARSAELAVIGQLRITISYPLLDGWHFRGRIMVEEVLFGKAKLGEELSYSFVCNGCPYWPRPNLEAFTHEKGLWLLLPGKNGDWLSAGGNFTPGRDADAPSMRELLRRRQAGTEPPVRGYVPPKEPWWKINLNRCWDQGGDCFRWR